MKPGLTFYTNMPTPYQLDFFDELKLRFDLTVVYFTAKENDRIWDLRLSGDGYKTVLLENSRSFKWIQQLFPSVHYSRALTEFGDNDANQFVIVNGTYWSPNVVLAIKTAAKRRKTVAFWSEAIFPVSNKLKIFIKRMLFKPVKDHTDFLMAIGRKAESCFREYGYANEIFNIPYNIRTDLFSGTAMDQVKLVHLQGKFGKGKDVIFLSSGSLIHRKGMDILINAFKRFPRETKAQLLIIGDGEDREILQSLIGGDSRIHLLGFQSKEDVPYFFRIADVFVFASRYDGWGLVINEAVAAGCAVISSDMVGAATDALVDGETAIICKSDDESAFHDAMNRMLDQSERSRFQRAVMDKAEVFSSEYNAKRVYEIFVKSNTGKGI